MDKIVIRGSRWKYLLLFLVGLSFVVAGIFLIVSAHKPSAILTGWMGVFFFGACSAVFVVQLIDSKPRLVIDENGIFDSSLKCTIPWEEITGAYVQSVQGQSFICLELIDEQKYIDKMSAIAKNLVAANRALGFSAINLNLSNADSNPDQVCELIIKRVAQIKDG